MNKTLLIPFNPPAPTSPALTALNMLDARHNLEDFFSFIGLTHHGMAFEVITAEHPQDNTTTH